MYFAGMTQAEVATELGIPISAVKARLHKGRVAMRARLRPFWREETVASKTEAMVPMEVRDVLRTGGKDWPGGHVVILAETGGRRILPIWIGQAEAIWLALALEGAEVPRPGTYSLMARSIEALGGSLREVGISRLTDEVFYSELVYEDRNGARQTIDARPSDALNLAAVLNAPILASAQVIEAAGRGRLGEHVRRALTEQRSEVVEAGASELAAEAQERWTSMGGQWEALKARLEGTNPPS
jgi:bifunctional DNase/RNase